MSDQQTVSAEAGNIAVVGIPQPTQFVMVIGRAIKSYPGRPGIPGIQLAAWVSNAISRYLNGFPGESSDEGTDGAAGALDGNGGNVGAVRLTNLGMAVQRGLDKWDAGHQQFGPSQANYVADSVIGWLRDTY